MNNDLDLMMLALREEAESAMRAAAYVVCAALLVLFAVLIGWLS